MIPRGQNWPQKDQNNQKWTQHYLWLAPSGSIALAIATDTRMEHNEPTLGARAPSDLNFSDLVVHRTQFVAHKEGVYFAAQNSQFGTNCQLLGRVGHQMRNCGVQPSPTKGV